MKIISYFILTRKSDNVKSYLQKSSRPGKEGERRAPTSLKIVWKQHVTHSVTGAEVIWLICNGRSDCSQINRNTYVSLDQNYNSNSVCKIPQLSCDIGKKTGSVTKILRDLTFSPVNSETIKGLFTWRWGTPGRWRNPPNHGRKIKRVYIQSYNPEVMRWGFLRLLLCLKLGTLSIGVPSLRLEKDER